MGSSTHSVEGLLAKIHDTLLFQIEWPEQFLAAPRAITTMGDCFIAVSPSIRNFSLVGSPVSEHELRYTTLIATLVQVSNRGTDAFATVLDRMATLYQTTATIYTTLEDIVRSTKAPFNASLVQSNVLTLRRQAKQCLVYCVDAHKAFVEWDALLIELRQSILAKQNQTAKASPGDPPATPARHPEPDPSLSSIPFSHPPIWGQTPFNDPIWVILPSLEACFRRVYKSITSGPGGTPDWAFLRSSRGRIYLTNLFLQTDAAERSMFSHPVGAGTDVYNIKGTIFPDCIYKLRELRNSVEATHPTSNAGSAGELLHGWSFIREVSRSRGHNEPPAGMMSTWDRNDYMDNLYYETLISLPPSPPRPNHDSVALSRSTASLVEVRGEVGRLVYFFATMETTARVIVEMHTVTLKEHARNLARPDVAPDAMEVERARFIQGAQTLMAYFSALHAVAGVYRRVHVGYIQTGARILIGLSAASTDDVIATRHAELRRYNTTISRDLPKYIEEERKKVIKEVKSAINIILNGAAAGAADQDNGWDSD